MTDAAPAGLDGALAAFLGGARRVAIVGVGDEANPADRLGMLTARALRRLRPPRVRVFLAGTVPEAVTGAVRRSRPDRVVLLDAADMGVAPGTAVLLDPGHLHCAMLSTHSLPLSVVMSFLERDLAVPVALVGVQPAFDAAGTSLTPAEEAGIGVVVAALSRTRRPVAGTGRGPRAPRR
jgi:hydrogenase 3 maturation protease